MGRRCALREVWFTVWQRQGYVRCKGTPTLESCHGSCTLLGNFTTSPTLLIERRRETCTLRIYPSKTHSTVDA